MKRIGMLLLGLLTITVLTACTGSGNRGEPQPPTENVTEQETPQTSPETEAAAQTTEPVTEKPAENDSETDTEGSLSLKAADFFYQTPDWYLFMKGDHPSSAEVLFRPEYAEGNRVQISVCEENAPCEVQVWEIREDGVVQTVSAHASYFRQNLLTAGEGSFQNLLDGPRDFLKDPIETGNTWSYGSQKMTIREVFPADANHGARVVVESSMGDGDGKELYTYEEGKWLVKHESILPDVTTTFTVDRYETELFHYPVDLYYPTLSDTEEEQYTKVRVYVPIPSNASNREVLARIYKEHLPGDGFPVLKAEDTIRSLYRNADGNVYLDLSRSFANMNAGAGGEVQVLKAMAYTAAGLLGGGDGVILTLEGELYEGGHVALEKGETLPSYPEPNDKIIETEP